MRSASLKSSPSCAWSEPDENAVMAVNRLLSVQIASLLFCFILLSTNSNLLCFRVLALVNPGQYGENTLLVNLISREFREVERFG